MIIRHLEIGAHKLDVAGQPTEYKRGTLAIVTDDCHPTIRRLAHKHSFYGFLTESEYNAEPLTHFQIECNIYKIMWVSEEHPILLKHFYSCCEDNLEWYDGDYEEEKYKCEQCEMHWIVLCELVRDWDKVYVNDGQERDDGSYCTAYEKLTEIQNKLIQGELFECN